jgi:hypothetical protein
MDKLPAPKSAIPHGLAGADAGILIYAIGAVAQAALNRESGHELERRSHYSQL